MLFRAGHPSKRRGDEPFLVDTYADIKEYYTGNIMT